MAGLSDHPCGACGEPATRAGIASFWRDAKAEKSRRPVGPVVYGCDHHAPEGYDPGEIRDPLKGSSRG